MIVSGVDGCRAGWVAISKDIDTGQISWRFFQDTRALIFSNPVPAVIAIDIPIGLPNLGTRDCDKEARHLLGRKRGSSVFPAPLRPLLVANDQDEASRIRYGIEQKKISIQSWGIVQKIKEVDEILRQNIQISFRLFEVHPEVCFYAMGGNRPAEFSKKTKAGRQERLNLLKTCFGNMPEAALADKKSMFSQNDDVLDAFAALWTAERIFRAVAHKIPVHCPRDSFDIPMCITY